MTGSDRSCPGRRRVVIVGGGFGGLLCARGLAGSDFEVVLIDRRNFHLFQPLLYQVATGGLSPADIASPLRGVLSGQRNLRVLMDEVVDFDLARRRVILAGTSWITPISSSPPARRRTTSVTGSGAVPPPA